jgi:putative membrane protein insertion efficiency factor
MSPAAAVLVGAVRTYQYTLRPFIGAHCRFEPSCSCYAVEALRRHGAARGAALAAWRVLRCNPWTEGGDDPVPDAAPNPEQPTQSRPRAGARPARTAS